MSLKVTRYSPYRSTKSNVVAFVSFHIPEWGLYLNDCKYIRKKNGGFFISFPARKIESDDGEKYISYFSFEKEALDRFQNSAEKAIQNFIKDNSLSYSE
jgi:hypothetical protein